MPGAVADEIGTLADERAVKLAEQHKHVQYALFLDRVVPESNLMDELLKYEYALVAAMSMDGHDLRINYERRLEVLRSLRAANARSRSAWGAFSW